MKITELLWRALVLAGTTGFCATVYFPQTHDWRAAIGLGAASAALAGLFHYVTEGRSLGRHE